MRDHPDGIEEPALRAALTDWQIDVADTAYAPVGFGDYHWTVTATDRRRYFVTLADLRLKGPGDGLAALRRAMDTAAELREQRNLDFVVAPLRAIDGRTVRQLDARYGLSVFPFREGTANLFEQPLTPADSLRRAELIAELHGTAPTPSTPLLSPALSERAALERALDELGRPWHGGPFAETARSLAAADLPAIRCRLDEFDGLVRQLTARPEAAVVTHGEPHPGNLLDTGESLLLVDWDTVGLALPERDLADIAADPEALARYTAATGRNPDPDALTLYRLRWDLEEIGLYLDQFRRPHQRTPDTELAWAGLVESVCNLAAG
jgi:spectinomycin phosphotransferase